jgi:hypothetical protein
MAWNGKIDYKPLILLQHKTAQETIEKNAYDIDEDHEELFIKMNNPEDILEHFQGKKKFPEANKFLAYAIHKRVGVWWAYLCVKMVLEEIEKAKLAKKPPRDIRKEVEDFIKNGLPEKKQLEKIAADHQKMRNENTAEAKSILQDPGAALKSGKIDQETHDKITLKEYKAFSQQIKTRFDAFPEDVKRDAMQKFEIYQKEYIKDHGMPFREHSLQELRSEIFLPKEPEIDNSLLDKTMQRIKDKIAEYKQEVGRELLKVPKSAADLPGLPKPVSKKKIDEAYESALHWILAPTDINAKYALNSGNAANGKMEGLLALCAFWAHGDLAVDQDKVKQVIPTNPGLTSNGINSVFTMTAVFAVTEGVEKSYDELMEEFHYMGIEAAQGINLWDDAFLQKINQLDKDKEMEGKSGIGRIFRRRS